MSNRINIEDLESYPKNGHGASQATKQTNGRKAIRQGALLKILSTKSPKPHTGGGRRGPQQGHSERSEKKLYNYLCTCHPSDYFITLTFAKPTEPMEAKESMGKFLRNLQNHLPFKPGAVAKMELQPRRMSVEFILHLWVQDGYCLEEELVQKLWDKATGSHSQIEFRDTDPDRWLDASDYASKEISVSDDCVTIGSVKMLLRLNDGEIFGSADENSLVLVTNPHYRAKLNISDKEIIVDRNLCNAWRYYQGQYVMKRNEASIPKYPKEDGYISQEMVNEIRYEVNSKRKIHFIGKDQYFSVTMDNAVKDSFFNDSEPSDYPSEGSILDADATCNEDDICGNDSYNVHSIINKVCYYFQSGYSAAVLSCRWVFRKINILKRFFY